MAYLTRWKMLIAADRQRNRGERVATIAETLGYESETAFRAAFMSMSNSPKHYQAVSQREGSCEVAQPPPNAFTRITLASMRRRIMSMSFRSLIKAAVCHVIT